MKRVSWWAAAVVLGLSTLAPACAQSSPWDYLKTYLDLKEKHGIATAQTEGVVEAKGVIQGKIGSPQAVTWMVRDEAGAQPVTYQFLSTTPPSGFEVGTRVRALGRGVATPGATVELAMMIRESEMAAWEASQAPKPSSEASARPQPSRVIVYQPAWTAPAAPPTPAAAAPPPSKPAPAEAEAMPLTRAAPPSQAPKGAAPPRWRSGDASKKPQAAPAAKPQAQTQDLASRGWAEYITRYAQAVRFFNPRMPLQQAEVIARSILAYSVHYRIDPRLVVAVIAAESSFNPNATSHKGAMGLGQLMPGTAAGLGVRDAYDPVENIAGAVKLLRGHLTEHSGKPFWDQLALALASYNAGSGAVKRYGGVPPYRETQGYIRKVGQLYAQLCGVGRK